MSDAVGVEFVVQSGEQRCLPGVLADRIELTPDAPFVTFESETVSFAEFGARAARAARALAALGAEDGSKIALMLPNCLEFLDLWFGAAQLGAVIVPVNTSLKGEGLRYILEHSDASIVVVDESAVEMVDQAMPRGRRSVVRLVRGSSAPHGYQILQEALESASPSSLTDVYEPDKLASILYTSGTTGPPKGVMICHNSYTVAGLEFVQKFVRIRSDDVLYTSLPLFHVNAQQLTVMGSIVSGRPMVLAPSFSASRFFDDLRCHRATVFNYIGAMLTMLFKQEERPDDVSSPARLAVGGAAPTELWPEFERRFGLTILEIYGLTETATFCLGSPPDDIRVGRIGKPVGWANVRIEDEQGNEAAPDVPGEIVVQSRHPATLFLGYYKREEATEEALLGGWFHTGDRGKRDAEGYFTFLDRLKDCIRRRGENISSYEVERVVNSHPSVAESAAVGVPSELGEEEVKVYVVIRPGKALDPVELVEHCAERMAGFMVPRYVEYRTELPKTATQRVQKYALRNEGVGEAWDRLAVENVTRVRV